MPVIKYDDEHNGIEIYFEEKPSEDTLEILKSNGWRWHRQKKCWYTINSASNLKTANEICAPKNNASNKRVFLVQHTSKQSKHIADNNQSNKNSEYQEQLKYEEIMEHMNKHDLRWLAQQDIDWEYICVKENPVVSEFVSSLPKEEQFDELKYLISAKDYPFKVSVHISKYCDKVESTCLVMIGVRARGRRIKEDDVFDFLEIINKEVYRKLSHTRMLRNEYADSLSEDTTDGTKKNTDTELVISNKGDIVASAEIITNNSNESSTVNQKENEIPPAEEYKIASTKMKRRVLFGIIFFILVELGVAGVFTKQILDKELHTRVVREFEINNTGKIKLASGEYVGETEFGYFHGIGEFSFKTGTLYSGEWEENQIKGSGILNIPIEGTYEGDFSYSQKNGQGKFTWNDGTIYEGEWKDDQMHGQGKYLSIDNVSYIGTFKDNKFYDGTCTFENNTGKYLLSYKEGTIDNAEISFTDGTTYSGDATTDNLYGIGTMIFPNEDEYSGSFENGKRNGQGVYKWASGESYDGEWSNDQMTGTGTYIYYDGSKASGTFAGNLFTDGTYEVDNEFGEYRFTIVKGEPIQAIIKLDDGTTYNGAMSGGKLNGSAQIKYSNGDTYNGNVSDGQKHGQGRYTWKSGASYDGSWKEDKMSGMGTYMYPDSEKGYKLTGEFENGKPDGTCQYYVSLSEHYKTDWSNGKCVKIYE